MFYFWVSLYRENIAEKIIALLAVGVSLSLLGCGAKAPRGYLKSGLTTSQIRSLAVLPFDNISGHPDAEKKVSNLLLTELARRELFKIAEMGEVENSLRSLRIRTTTEIDSSNLQKLGEQLNVQAIIIGSVDEYELRKEKSGTVPVVAINIRMLGVQTGDILWAISNAHDGNDWETIFGFGRIISLNELAQVTISEMVESLAQKLK